MIEKIKLVQTMYGDKSWIINGFENHRNGGAAEILCNGRIRFWINKNWIHRANGPAHIYLNGEEWYISGINITDQLHSYCHSNNIAINDYTNISKSDKLKLKIKFGLQL